MAVGDEVVARLANGQVRCTGSEVESIRLKSHWSFNYTIDFEGRRLWLG